MFLTPYNELRRLIIAAPGQNADSRCDALLSWLAQFDGFAGADPKPASGDASFRRYFRVLRGTESFIVMDAPPPHEDCRPFGADFENGFILMTDLGSTRYLDELEKDRNRAPDLYDDAIDALLMLQEKGEAYQQQLPNYDYDFIAFELSIFRDWLCGRHLGIDFSDDEEKRWQQCCELLIDNALQQKQVFMHRDYHSRNLMLTSENNPGILDFQDAVEGPLTYDVVSLFKDCYIKWPADEIRAWALRYFDRLNPALKDDLTADDFVRQFDLMGVQRHLKAAGIFARLLHRDGKSGYMNDIPRTLSYISDVAPQYPELGMLSSLVEERILPSMETSD
jgi:aminoglycoside/choline kinase family phosphotransferase